MTVNDYFMLPESKDSYKLFSPWFIGVHNLRANSLVELLLHPLRAGRLLM